MTTSHTPAPWTLNIEETTEEGGMPIRAIDKKDGMRFRVADVYGVDVNSEHCAESKANARLISAAPELLESLMQIVEWMESPGDGAFSDSQLLEAKAAIAKATCEAQ